MNTLFRLTPAYAYVILLSVGLFKYFGRGPYWLELVEALDINCENDWWSNLIYINNFYPTINSVRFC